MCFFVASHTSPTGNLACNPDMCTDWESNGWPFGLQAGSKSTEPHRPGPLPFSFSFFNYFIQFSNYDLFTYPSIHSFICPSTNVFWVSSLCQSIPKAQNYFLDFWNIGTLSLRTSGDLLMQHPRLSQHWCWIHKQNTLVFLFCFFLASMLFPLYSLFLKGWGDTIREKGSISLSNRPGQYCSFSIFPSCLCPEPSGIGLDCWRKAYPP